MCPAPDPFHQPPKLVKPGVSDSKLLGSEPTQIVTMKLGSAKNLHELLSEYQFYTPALLHLTVPLQFDPFDLFCEEYGQPVVRFTAKFDKPLFGGLVHPNGDTSWNYTLFGLPLEHWEAYRAWIGSVAFDDRAKNLFRRVRTQDIHVLDPLGTESIPITALVIESNKGAFYYKMAGHVPCATFDATLLYNDTIGFAEALSKGSSNPYGYVERTLNAHKDSLPRTN